MVGRLSEWNLRSATCALVGRLFGRHDLQLVPWLIVCLYGRYDLQRVPWLIACLYGRYDLQLVPWLADCMEGNYERLGWQIVWKV